MSESKVIERFLRYVQVGTTSKQDEEVMPSTRCQWVLARKLAAEMAEMGLVNVRVSQNCYVFGEIPATTDKDLPVLGFVAHMDTAPDAPGEPVKPRIVRSYDGEKIDLCEGVSIDPAVTPSLRHYVGQDLIVTDGHTLLGADDKAGIAEILTMAERVLADTSREHGKIVIGFTPDEEVGRGPDLFDVKDFGADIAYTVDGGPLGEIEYENFNAASATVNVQGFLIHPGTAKGTMKNALTIGMEFDRMLPMSERPETSEGYEGYYYLTAMEGSTDHAVMHYILRDFEQEGMDGRKALMKSAAEFLNRRYGDCVEVVIRDSYRNMKEMILPHFNLIEAAQEAYRACGVTPFINPCRGGTDGATLSFMGLPCPNLSACGENMHSVTEYVSVQAMEKMTDVLCEIVDRLAR
ncbi:MAG: peptidase T [Lachnospiraceae bacterium]|nr:peptidase T [Lachnospiraceae bacterium]